MDSDDAQKRYCANHMDFAPYIAAVTESSKRSRSVIYLIITAVVTTLIVTYSGFYSNWQDRRLSVYQTIYECWKTNFKEKRCSDAKRAMDNPAFPVKLPEEALSEEEEAKSERVRQFKKQIDLLMEKRAGLYAMQWPVLGLSFDVNDLGLVSGVALLILLLILRASQIREADNVERAMRRARDERSLELLIMAQVLSQPRQRSRPAAAVTFAAFSVPFLTHFLTFYSDFQTQAVGSAVAGRSYVNVQIIFEAFLLFSIAFVSYSAWKRWKKQDELLAEIQAMIELPK